MIGISASIALRLAGCGFVAWGAWRLIGPAGLAMIAPLFGIALAKPLIILASDVRHEFRRRHWQDVEGRHYAFRGQSVRVVEDEARRRWVHLADIRAIVGFTASDNALAIAYPDGIRRIGRPAAAHVSDETLLAHLSKERSPEAARLRLWVEREIVFPARRERERLAGPAAAKESVPGG